ncbi:unnamed protein product, partial [Rotaria sp. Silwood2]
QSINSGSNMSEPILYPQTYAQSTSYYDDSNIEQRENLFHSLSQNIHILRGFYQFLDFICARNAQQSLQPISSDTANQGYQRELPSILTVKTRN